VDLSRRKFIQGTATGAAGTALAGGVLIGGERADAATLSNPAAAASYPFHGGNQSGVLTPGPSHKQAFTCVAAFDSTAYDTDGLAGLLQTITARARFLTSGGTPPNLGASQPPSDSDVLGPVVPADGLTVTLSAGWTLFDDRYGLTDIQPLKLGRMPVFPNDSPEDAWLDGDLLVQLCANHPDTVHHALRDITKHTGDGMQLRWMIEGYASPPRPSGTGRNMLGFKDGTANPTGSLAGDLVWVDDPAEPAWAQGGSYLVVRLIRMLVQSWDGVSVNQQERIFGRRRDSGAPLGGNSEYDAPNYKADPQGKVIPLDAHMRLANPDTPQTDNQRLIRRSYNYNLGMDSNGNLKVGHIFIAYQQDVERQFATVQQRLIDEPLANFVQPFGGGYFFTLPGVRDASDWYGKTLLA
jgi:deferrochelatase/peroxidase EfeB